MKKGLSHRWIVVLAAGEGLRLREFVREHFGSNLPKQFSAIIGTRSMVRHTTARARKLVPVKNIRIVICATHRSVAEKELDPREDGSLVILPCNRETAASVLLPVLQILQQDPAAVVGIFPSDHFILEENHFLTFVDDAFQFVECFPDHLALLGIRPSDPDPQYGWIRIHPGFLTLGTSRFHKVREFYEKPTVRQADRLYQSGGLWNSMVVIGWCATLADLFRKHLPEVHDKLEEAVARFVHTLAAPDLDAVFSEMPSRNFSKDLLEKVPHRLRVSRVEGVHWSDWGNPDRILGDLALLGLPLPGERGTSL